MTRKWLKTLRTEKKLTQEEVAKRAGIARSYYTHLETGVKRPSPEVAISLGKVLGFQWVIFFEEEGSSKEHKGA